MADEEKICFGVLLSTERVKKIREDTSDWAVDPLEALRAAPDRDSLTCVRGGDESFETYYYVVTHVDSVIESTQYVDSIPASVPLEWNTKIRECLNIFDVPEEEQKLQWHVVSWWDK